MRCVLVFYLVVTIFVIVYSSRELCDIQEKGGIIANCRGDTVRYIFDFIPPISQNISHLVLKDQPLKQLPYNAFRNLSSQNSVAYIWLGECQISHVDAGALLNLHNLTTIDFSHNEITQIDSALFSHTKHIKHIHLGFNKIEVVPTGLFANLPLLELVHLYDNRLRQVENYSFKNTPALRLIDLRDNQIEFLSVLFKDNFDNLRTLSLAGNPWRCICKLAPLYDLLVQIKQLNHSGPVCEKPPRLHGRKWRSMSRDQFGCRSDKRKNCCHMDRGLPMRDMATIN